jgi:ribosomal protein S18 acetylase RimI-like enzyme
MEITRLQDDEIESFVEELWAPAQREMAAGKRYTLKEEIREPGIVFNRSQVSDDDAATYLAHHENAAVGYVTAEIQTPPPMVEQIRECHIIELFVKEDARRQGVAMELLSQVEQWGETHDSEYSKLMVSTDNHAAIDLYESKDYEISRQSMKKQIQDDR